MKRRRKVSRVERNRKERRERGMKRKKCFICKVWEADWEGMLVLPGNRTGDAHYAHRACYSAKTGESDVP